MYWPINYAGRKTSCVRTLLLGLEVQIHSHFSSRFLIDSLHEYDFHCLYSETHWFEWSAFVVSSTDIPNPNPEVHIQHVAERFDQKYICFKHIPCNVYDYHRAPRRKNISPSAKKNQEYARYWSCLANTYTECTWSYILQITKSNPVWIQSLVPQKYFTTSCYI